MENSNENAYPIKNKCKYLKVFQKEKIKEKPFQSTYNSTLLHITKNVIEKKEHYSLRLPHMIFNFIEILFFPEF